MAQKTHYEISPEGQVVEVVTRTATLANPELLFDFFKTEASKPQKNEVPEAAPVYKAYHNIGCGVSIVYKPRKASVLVWGAIRLPVLLFQTRWTVLEDPKVNGGKSFIAPSIASNAATTGLNLGGPLKWVVPNDLIFHLVMEGIIEGMTDPLDVPLNQMFHMPEKLMRMGTRCFLTCFSISRNTCVVPPLPNTYDDGSLCTGSAFSDKQFSMHENHDGFVSSMLAYREAWMNTSWNLHLMGGENSKKSARYQKLIRFDANTCRQLPYEGCASWDMMASNVPLTTLYAPWLAANAAAVKPIKAKDEEGLTDGTLTNNVEEMGAIPILQEEPDGL